MKGNNIDKQFSDEVLLPIQDLSKHYKELSQKKHNPTIKQPNESKNFENSDLLNADITVEEIKQTMKKVKSKQAPENDSITNEIITCPDIGKIGKTIQQKLSHRLLSKFLEWGASFFINQMKKNQINYRGITLSNSLGRFFNTVLYNRLTTKLQNTNILSPA